MKTTVDISDALFAEAKHYCQLHGLSFREVVETGLRNVVTGAGRSAEPFRLQDGSFRGDGMVKDFTWPELISIVYEGRGGE